MNTTSTCITHSRQGPGVVARLLGGGLMHPGVAERLSEELIHLLDDPPAPRMVHVDLGHLQTVSSLVLNQLIVFNSQARSRGIQVLMIGVQPAVREVFVLTRLDRMFQLEGDSEPAALLPPAG